MGSYYLELETPREYANFLEPSAGRRPTSSLTLCVEAESRIRDSWTATLARDTARGRKTKGDERPNDRRTRFQERSETDHRIHRQGLAATVGDLHPKRETGTASRTCCSRRWRAGHPWCPLRYPGFPSWLNPRMTACWCRRAIPGAASRRSSES